MHWTACGPPNEFTVLRTSPAPARPYSTTMRATGRPERQVHERRISRDRLAERWKRDRCAARDTEEALVHDGTQIGGAIDLVASDTASKTDEDETFAGDEAQRLCRERNVARLHGVV